MKLGIDLGTTRTVVACSDRGNYPVVSFEDGRGDPVDWFPSVVAAKEGELRFGFEAEAALGDPTWTVLRSWKRLLGTRAGTDFEVAIGETSVPASEIIARFLSALREAIVTKSNCPKKRNDKTLVATVATPASAHGAQRFATLDGFRRAGFGVAGMLNEPSAAGFEYAHRYRSTVTSRREHIVVYDLGGGTFDASLVAMTGQNHDAVATGGASHLGGDDFDAILVAQALEAAALSPDAMSERALFQLREQCREAKERLHPSSRKIVLDIPLASPARSVTVAVDAYYERCAPLVERTIEAMAPVLARLAADGEDPLSELAGIYVVGGASALPVVGRVLRERFGRRVHRSAYPSAAIAIGLAIAGDADAGFELSDRLSRQFGVFRESHAGLDVVFDPIFHRESLVPRGDEPTTALRRRYRAAHNVGRYRFVECTSLDEHGVPVGDITAYRDILFPFDPAAREHNDLASVPIRRLSDEGPWIEEEYVLTRHGMVKVTIRDVASGFTRAFDIGA